ncbi:MAG: tetratricopeptide repeat protein [Saprospiraceae bacterium]
MKRAHWIVLGVAAALFVLLYWGLERRPPNMRGVDSVRTSNMSSTSANALIREASGALDAREEAEIHGFEKMLDGATSDSRKVELLKQLSGAWYRTGNPAIAGHYAEQIAELMPSDTTWGMAATTYTLCLRADSLTTKQRDFCTERALPAYENAISLAAESSTHKVNLALHYADNPPANNPMRGIRMLLDLNKENPEDVAVLVQLGRLALQTNQNDKALGRLTLATELEPDNRTAQCLLSEAARRTGNDQQAASAETACRKLYDQESNL